MANRAGLRTATIAVALIASLAAVPAAGASTPFKSRGSASHRDAAAIGQGYTPRVVLPGDASAAGVQADRDTWMVNARAGAETRNLARRFGGRAIGLSGMGIFVVSRDRARAFSSALRSRGLLRSAGPNVVRHRTQAAPGADPLTPQQWWRPAVVNPATPTPPVDPATSPKLGLVDSMPDLAHAEWAGSNFTSLGAGTVAPETAIGHGTATASVAAAPVNGVGIIGIWPGMLAVNSPLPEQILCADSVRGIAAVIQAGAKVVNMSYGSPSACDGEYLVLQAAVALGVIPVASAGNELAEGNPPEFPASYPHVLTIAAINQAGLPTIFSNANAAVDLGAPGENILSAVPVAADQDGTADGYTALAGTSFSSPIVAAATTWVRAARPDLQPDQVAQAVRLSAVDIAPAGYDSGSGFGMLNIDRALAVPAAQLPPHEPLEPNDIVALVDGSTGVLPRQPILFNGQRGVRGDGTLDLFEDPADIYRITLPARRSVLVSVKPLFGDVDVAVYNRNAESLSQTSRILKRSRHAGRKTDAVTVRNRGKKRAAYVAVTIHRGSSLADAGYRLTIRRR
jgi:subtilisin family serine protease